MKLDFLGATEEVTGSKFLLTTKDGIKILLDCGMYQGKGLETDAMNRDLGFDPTQIDIVLLSHAHIDHAGLIPYIYKLGFRGKVFCTPATRDLCAIMLADSGRIQEADARQFNKKKERVGKTPIEPIYNEKDAVECMRLFISIPRGLHFNITPTVAIDFIDSGHMLGSSAIYLTFKEGRKTRTLCYTGDVGRYDKRILPDPEPFPYADYIITESTYGDRLHSTLDEADKELMLVVRDACAKRKGKLLIGYIGQVHPEAVENYDMKTDVYVAVLDMDTVTMLAKEEVKYKGLARFPGSSRDLALVCDKSVLAGDVEKILRKCGGALLEKITLFDVYEGEQVGADKKSLAYSLLFRAPDRTLADTEVNEKIEKMLSALGEKGITLRA